MKYLNSNAALAVIASSVIVACANGDAGSHQGSASQPVSGAVYTTFDSTTGGCQNSDNGINCNAYTAKEDVYVSGGPAAAGLSDGTFFFAVLAPGAQHGGFVDGAKGNLSDTTAGEKTDLGSGDRVENRTFTVANHEIVAYSGSHATGTSPNGKLVIQAMPFDDTPNHGGVYILAICELGATSPSQCKFDAFKIGAKAETSGSGGSTCDSGDDDESCMASSSSGGETAGAGGEGGASAEGGAGEGGAGGKKACCGNGIVEPGEACDDGNTVSGDGCSADCQLETDAGCGSACAPKD